MYVAATNATMGDLDVDVCLLEFLGLKLLPSHLALDGFGALAQPALELVIGRHGEGKCLSNGKWKRDMIFSMFTIG